MKKFDTSKEIKDVIYENCLPGMVQCPHCEMYMCPYTLCAAKHRFSHGDHACIQCKGTIRISPEDAAVLNERIDEDIKEKKEALLSA